MNTLQQIMMYNRNPQLNDWFKSRLEQLIGYNYYHDEIPECTDAIIDELVCYRTKNNIKNVVIGISGGLDSALTARLFQMAGYEVTGVTMPIFQVSTETDRAYEFCEDAKIELVHADLSDDFVSLHGSFARFDPTLKTDTPASLVRQGNIKARLRMNFLYNLAASKSGLVASTDNFSELAAGFWTLHGDVGDVAPIQSLLKSWEVPAMAEHVGVPASIINAVPTDGLGISTSDEEQFGFSYLEFDIALLIMLMTNKHRLEENMDGPTQAIFNEVRKRVESTAFKRANPVNIPHPMHLHSDRFDCLDFLDK